MIISKSVESFYYDSDLNIELFGQEIVEHHPTQVFLTLLWEAFDFRPVFVKIDNFFQSRGIQITWVLTEWCKSDPGWSQLTSPKIFIDYMHWRSYNEIANKHKSQFNGRWNSDAARYLFLIGKPAKTNRIGLLYQLEKHNLLERCDYSLFMNEGNYNESRSWVAELDDDQYRNFINRHCRKLDDISPVMQEFSLHYGGIPYDHKIYAGSLFRLISETSMNLLSRPLISEKTWLTIANKNPFVIAGERNTCKYLRSLGFETFDQMWPIPSYDNITNVKLRLDFVVEHVKHWLTGNFDKKWVEQSVEHNYMQFVKLAREIQNHFENSAGVDIDTVVDTRDDITKF